MTTATTTCPKWCTDHAYDHDGSLITHDLPFTTPDKEAWVTLHQDETGYDPKHFVDIQIQGGNCWAAAEIEALIKSLAKAAAALRYAPVADEVAWLASTDWEHRDVTELFLEAERLGLRPSELLVALEQHSGRLAAAK